MEDYIERVSDFSVRELDSSNARYFNLSGRALPHRPIAFGTSLIKTTTNYQGNPVSAFQISSSKQDLTVIKGRWSGRYIDGVSGEIHYGEVPNSDGQIEVLDSTLLDGYVLSSEIWNDKEQAMIKFCEWMDEFVATGPIVEVVWLSRARHGVVDKFSYEISDSRDISWEMTLEWNSYKVIESRSRYKNVESTTDLSKGWLATLKMYRMQLEQMFGLDPLSGMYGPNIPIVSAAFDIIRKVNDNILKVNAAIEEVELMNKTLVTAMLAPSQAARNILGLLSNVGHILDEMAEIWEENTIPEMTAWENTIDGFGTKSWQDSMSPNADSERFDSNVFYEYGLGGGSPILAGKYLKKQSDEIKSYKTMIRDMKTGFSSASIGFDMRELMRIMRFNLYSKVNEIKKLTGGKDSVKAVEVATESQHIGHMAMKHYGDWVSWIKLARFNNISSPVLNAGQLVLIPEILHA